MSRLAVVQTTTRGTLLILALRFSIDVDGKSASFYTPMIQWRKWGFPVRRSRRAFLF